MLLMKSASPNAQINQLIALKWPAEVEISDEQ